MEIKAKMLHIILKNDKLNIQYWLAEEEEKIIILLFSLIISKQQKDVCHVFQEPVAYQLDSDTQQIPSLCNLL
jgi:hypothetical protein